MMGVQVFSTQSLATTIDALGRPNQVVHNNDPADYETFTYSCCGLQSHRARDGTVTSYIKDSIDRTIAETTTLGARVITRTYNYSPSTDEDTLDYPATTVTTTATGVTGSIVQKTVRDVLGRTVSTSSPGPMGTLETTEYLYSPDGLITTQRNPDLGTIVTESYPDGRTKSVSGTATIESHYTYSTHNENGGGELISVTSGLASENLLSSVSSYSDLAGRTFKTERTAPNGQIAETITTFNALGQAETITSSGQPSVRYIYNPEGERVATWTDRNGDGQFNDGNNPLFPDVKDACTTTQSDYIPAASAPTPLGDCRRTITTVRTEADEDKVISTTWQSVDGLRSHQETLGVANPSIATRTKPLNGASTSTQTNPDGTSVETATSILPNGNAQTASIFKDTSSSILQTSTMVSDAIGRTLQSTNGRGHVTQYAYHLHTPEEPEEGPATIGQTASVTQVNAAPGGGNLVTSYTYTLTQGSGRSVETTLPDTSKQYQNSNLRGQITRQWGSQTNPVSFTYDSVGNQATMTTYRAPVGAISNTFEGTVGTTAGDTTTWRYDASGALLGKRDAADQEVTYTYDIAGRVLTRTWARGVVTTYGYTAGQLTSTTYTNDPANTPAVSIAYDRLGRQVRQSNGLATTDYDYDSGTLALDTETVRIDPDGPGSLPALTRILDRNRDNLGREGSTGILPVSSGSAEHSLTYGYNASGRLASVTSPAGTFSYTYAPGSSLLESVTTPVHVVTNTWEPNRDVLDVKDNRIPSTTTPISSFNYGVNAIGQRTEVTTTGSAFPSQPADWTWGYDAFGQVTSADSSTNTFDRAYTYDQIGNRKKSADGELVTTGPSAITYDPNPLNQYSGVGAFSPTYDADGNQKDAQTLPLGSPSLVSCVYHWDAENRLIAVKDTNNADIVTYIYDSQSRRVARTQGANTTVYLYDGWNCLAEYTLHNSSFNLHTSLSWGLDLSGSLQGAGGVGGLLAVTEHQAENTTHFFPTYDGNGNVSEYLDAGGAVAAHYEYDPFGRVIVATGSQAADFAYRFSTKPRDAATGLYCYGYRWYDPDTGRWINRDPIEERGGVNLYGFVGNAPIFIYDILGLDYEMKIKGDSKLLNNKPQTRLMGAFLTKGQNYAEWEPQGAKSGNIPFPRNLANPNDTYSEIYLFLVTSNSRPTGKRPGEVQTPSGLEFEQDRRKEDWFYPHLTHIIKISIDPKSAEFKVDATANTTWGWEGAGEQPQNNEYIAVGSIFSASVADKNTLNLDYWGIGGWDPDYPIIMKGGPLSATRGPLAKNAGPLDMAQGPGVPGGGVFPHKQSKTGWGFPDGVYPEVVWDTKGTLEEIKKAKKRQVGLPWDPHRSPWPGGLRTNGPLGSIQFSLECVKK